MCSSDLVNVQGGVVDALGWGSPPAAYNSK